MEKENQLIFIDEEGNEILCEILFTFDSKEFGKNYVLFYPASEKEGEEVSIMAASYTPTEDGNGELEHIETDEEWELIEDVLDQFFEDEENEEGHHHHHHHHHHDCDCNHDEECECDEDDECECKKKDK